MTDDTSLIFHTVAITTCGFYLQTRLKIYLPIISSILMCYFSVGSLFTSNCFLRWQLVKQPNIITTKMISLANYSNRKWTRTVKYNARPSLVSNERYRKRYLKFLVLGSYLYNEKIAQSRGVTNKAFAKYFLRLRYLSFCTEFYAELRNY